MERNVWALKQVRRRVEEGNHGTAPPEGLRRIGLFLGVTPRMGGVFPYSRCLLDAVAALPRERYAAVAAYTDPAWEEPVAAAGLDALRIRWPRWTFGLGTLFTLSSIPVPWWRPCMPLVDPAAAAVVRARCDLWVFTTYSFVCYQMPVSSVGIVHDLMHRYERRFRVDNPPRVRYWRERVFRRMCRRTRALLADSELGRRQLVESYGADDSRIFALPFVAPPNMADAVPAGFDARYRLPGKFVFYPAQFWEHKNHARLIRAAAALRAELPDLHLVLAGGRRGAYAEVRALVNRLNLDQRVTFMGFVPDDDLVELYRRARALVFPSFYGPTNIPPLEAFAVGCPVAASRVYAMPEQIGEAGLLFDPHSVEEIAGAIRRVWTDDALCRELARRGRERAAQWGPAEFARRFAGIVDDILRQDAGRRGTGA